MVPVLSQDDPEGLELGHRVSQQQHAKQTRFAGEKTEEPVLEA